MSDDDVRVHSDERRRLLAELELERNQLIRNIETCRIRDIDRPFIGEWSLKDIVAHVVAWEAECTDALGQVREGKRPAIFDADPATESGQRQIDESNRVQVEAMRGTPFWVLLEELHGGRQSLLEATGLFTDDELCGDNSMSAEVVREVLTHDRRHWHEIAAKLAGMAGVRAVSPEPNPAATTTTS